VSVGQIKSLIFKLSPIIFLVTIGIIVFAKHIVLILSGSVIQNIVVDIYILSLIIIFGTFNNIIGILGFINLNMTKEFKKNVIYTGLFSITITTILSIYYDDIGASIGLVLSETLLLLLLIFDLFLKRKLT